MCAIAVTKLFSFTKFLQAVEMLRRLITFCWKAVSAITYLG